MSILGYLLKLEPNYVLCIAVFLASIILLLFTILFVKEKFTFTKENGPISDKPRFFTKFLGVLFILSLSFAANNAFVYIISILIVATLVTELQFLEMLIALIWNRPEYVKGRLEALNKQQEEKETDKKRLNEMETFAKNAGEMLEAETIKKNQYLLFYHFEKIYRLIFGSQINILLDAEMNQGKIDLPKTVLMYRISGWNEKGYNIGNYTSFLLNMGLLNYTTGKMPEDCFYSLTPLGRSFLQYLRENNIPLNKPF